MTEHPIRLRNTKRHGREPEPFVPRDWREGAPVAEADRRVRLYVCGPTVYARAHIGNARPAVVFDVLVRLLREVYGPERVIHVSNLTDVDDKINARAAATLADGEGEVAAIARITAETVAWYHEDMASLGVAPPDHEPRATGYIPEMVAMIETLIAGGHAYAAEGHVLFSVPSWPAYGSLSRRPLDEMRAGARVEVAPYKRDPMDFVLWKPSDATQPGWDSPWGRGRPGWHIECSAMAKALLGAEFDIHGGGIDLAFPHHENELAQSCCANGTRSMADVWLHNGYLMVEGEKMSKSLGNFTTVHDLRTAGVPGEVIRLVLLGAHYRQPLDWTEARVAEAEATLRRWREIAGDAGPGEMPARVRAALADDLNTPRAIAELHRLAGQGDAAGLRAGAGLMGLLGENLGGWDRVEAGDAGPRIESLLSARLAARRARDFARADAIRDGLAAAGVEVKDTPQGPEWQLSPRFDPTRLADLEADA